MQVKNNNYINFNGYGARPLRGLFLRRTDLDILSFDKITSQLETIGQKQGFDVFVQTNKGIYSKNSSKISQDEYLRGCSEYTWCQDNLTFLPQNKFVSNAKVINKLGCDIEKFFGFQNFRVKNHVAGGNYYVIDDNGKKELLLGRFNMDGIAELINEFNIRAIQILPQADFHLDLFVRPLKNKTILVANDSMLYDRVSEIIKQIDTNVSLTRVCEKLKAIKNKLKIMNDFFPEIPYCSAKTVQNKLLDAGYNVVKVPGRVFEYVNDENEILPRHILNYMNGIVHENKDGELVYITNKSNLNKYCGITKDVANKIGFDFESEFINSVKDYIKPENIYFVDTQKFLKIFQGGIHCLVSEIPKFD